MIIGHDFAFLVCELECFFAFMPSRSLYHYLWHVGGRREGKETSLLLFNF